MLCQSDKQPCIIIIDIRYHISIIAMRYHIIVIIIITVQILYYIIKSYLLPNPANKMKCPHIYFDLHGQRCQDHSASDAKNGWVGQPVREHGCSQLISHALRIPVAGGVAG